MSLVPTILDLEQAIPWLTCNGDLCVLVQHRHHILVTEVATQMRARKYPETTVFYRRFINKSVSTVAPRGSYG